MVISDNQRLVLTSCSTFETAVQISKIMVTEKLAYKCSIQPHLTSFYSWNNNIQEKHEYFVYIFSNTELLESIEKRIVDFGFDDDQQIVALSINEIGSTFKDWTESIIK